VRIGVTLVRSEVGEPHLFAQSALVDRLVDREEFKAAYGQGLIGGKSTQQYGR
jgi:hypothetical protein